jgi:hypothetical protein
VTSRGSLAMFDGDPRGSSRGCHSNFFEAQEGRNDS